MQASSRFSGSSSQTPSSPGPTTTTVASSVGSSGPSHVSGTAATVASMWDSIWQREGGEEGADAGGDDWTSSRDALVFLVDCNPFMLRPMASGERPLDDALQCIATAVTQKLVASPLDDVAVVLFGTANQQGDFPGVFVVADFDKPSAQLVERLDELRAPGGFTYGHWSDANASEFPLCDAFWTASSLLNRQKNVAERRVWLFTDNDAPHADPDLLARARARLDDYRASGVSVSLFAFQRRDAEPFNLAHFYCHLPDEDLQGGTGAWMADQRLSGMMQRISHKIMKKRAQASVRMTLVPGVEWAVSMFTLIRRAEEIKSSLLDPETMFPVKPLTRWVCEDTGTSLRGAQIKKYVPFGDKKVVFEADEMTAMKQLYPTGIVVLGFKDLALLRDVHNLHHATFIFPDEAAVRNGTLPFKTLLDRCAARSKFVLARVTPRRTSGSRLAALVPAREVYDENDVQTAPSGFHVVMLPWADELRNIEAPGVDFEESTPTREQMHAASLVAECLLSDLEISQLPNPTLQKHFAVLQTYALGKEEPLQQFVDTIEPDKEGLAAFAQVIDQWRDTCFPEGYEEAAAPVKRERRARDTDGDAYEGDFAELLASDANQRMVTIPQLKHKLKELGLRVGGNKAALWERLKEARDQGKIVASANAAVKVKGESDDDDAPQQKRRKQVARKPARRMVVDDDDDEAAVVKEEAAGSAEF